MPVTKLFSRVIGIPDAVFIRSPEDIRTLFNNDGKNPIEPGFDFFVKYRQELRQGLVTLVENQGCIKFPLINIWGRISSCE